MNAHAIHATQLIGRITDQWRGAPPVTVVEWPADLPVKGAPADVRGMFRGGETWIVANTQSASKVGETLAHEVLGHAAMRESLGRKWRPFMHAIQGGLRAGDERLHLIRSEVRATYVDHAGEFNLSSVAESDEIVAAVAEYGFNAVTGRMIIPNPIQKLAHAANGQFLRETMYLDWPATFEQLEGALVAAEHRLRHGGHFWGIGRKVRDWYASSMSKSWNPKQPPMSLRESENLLRAEADRAQWWEDIKLIGNGLMGIGGIPLVVIGAIAFVWNIGSLIGFFR